MKICIIGQGYIGLPTAALFANSKCEVLGVDRNQPIVDALNQGNIHIEEPGIRKILKLAISKQKYRASISPEESDVFIITVPTPTTENNLSCDLNNVFSACESILPCLKENNIVIIESTIAPMSTDDFIKPIFEKDGWKIGKNLYLSHCPERVLPGKIMDELVNNDRIIGGVTPKCADKSSDIYKKFVKGDLIKTEAKTAELAKCMENTFRDVNIALANELAKICSKIEVNTLDVIEMANKHPRVNIHFPGPGVGGHCLAIDPYFIYSKAPSTAKLIKTARDINNSMPKFVVEKTEKILKKVESNNGSTSITIAILGVAYKGNTGDTRESPAIEIIKSFKNKGYDVKVHDPHVNNPGYLNFKEVIDGATICLVLADHDEFKNLNYDLLISKMKVPLIFDTKNIVKAEKNNVEVVNYGNIYDHI
ncbi:MAG: nucleotide sugar dehydrogenase [Methanobacteriaceae archaeon]|jgi:UDP-N-acetyl-D-mannosaminuronic acid dehydrogenase|nr:nucleotide sugar dehydrogenase [Candidatus Methanorudis spinitermitis]